MAGQAPRKGRNGNKTFGRRKNKPCQQRYVNEGRSDKNKVRKAQKYANKFGVEVKVRVDGLLKSIAPTTEKAKAILLARRYAKLDAIETAQTA